MHQITNMNWFRGKVGPLNLYQECLASQLVKPPQWLCCCLCHCTAMFCGLMVVRWLRQHQWQCSPELWHDHDRIQCKNRKWNTKQGITCVYRTKCVMDITDAQPATWHRHTDKSSCYVCLTWLWKCAREWNGKLWKQIKMIVVAAAQCTHTQQCL